MRLWALSTLCITSLVAARAHAACGDAVLEATESCDDGNTTGSDGCTASCQIEAGYVCGSGVCCFQDAAAAYTLLADATHEAAQGIVTLTPDATWKLGTAWYRERLDFSAPFTISVRLFLGTHDGTPNGSSPDLGADGGSLIFQRDARGFATKGEYAGATGQDGGELGAKGISPVVGVEFDTYNNGPSFGDSVAGDEDHVSVFQGGTRSQLAPAVCMNDGAPCTDFEDGKWHRFDVAWTGDNDHHLRVYVDGAQRIDLDRDLVRDFFNDDPKNIIFGFAANTGGYFNQQRFCPLAPYGFGVPRDADGDGIDDALDPDSDGDGKSDLEETSLTADPDLDGDADGVPNYRDVDFWTELGRAADCADAVAPIGACDSLIPALDFDRDGVADHLDLDSDQDGTPDATDTAPRDPCMPTACALPDAGVSIDAGVVDAGVKVDASAPPPASAAPSPGDLDGDGVGNEVDPAPNDPCKPNRNALACGTGDADNDKLSNAFECPDLSMCRDTDRDGVPDYADPDSDGDGIPDAKECPDMNACPDSDQDGTPDLLQAALVKNDDGCALTQNPTSGWWLLLLLLSARTGSFVRSATARACGGRRSLPWSRAARRPRPATPRSS